MNKFKTDKPFKNDELRNMDIIHNPDVKLFKDQYEGSYVIEEFINDKEKDILIDKNLFIPDGFNVVVNGNAINLQRIDLLAKIGRLT